MSDPLDKLTAFSRKIADGKYGMQEEVVIDNEIGNLTVAINECPKIAMADKTRDGEYLTDLS